MAVNKTINKRTNTHGAMRNCIEYVLRQDKTSELLTYITGPYCHNEINYDLVYRTFLEEKKMWNKDTGRMYAHNIISWHKDEQITPEQAFEFGKEFAENWFSGFQTLVAVHKDKDHIHCHLVTNSVSYEDGRKLHNTRKDLERMKQLTNQMCRERGLTVAEKGKHFDGSQIEKGEVIAWSKDKYNLFRQQVKDSFVADCAMAVLKALENCISKEKFIEKMKQFGWNVNWTEKRKHITFQNQEGKKVRDSNLFKTFHLDISKEGLENEFNGNRKKARDSANRDSRSDEELAGYYRQVEAACEGAGGVTGASDGRERRVTGEKSEDERVYPEISGKDTQAENGKTEAILRESRNARRNSEIKRRNSSFDNRTVRNAEAESIASEEQRRFEEQKRLEEQERARAARRRNKRRDQNSKLQIQVNKSSVEAVDEAQKKQKEAEKKIEQAESKARNEKKRAELEIRKAKKEVKDRTESMKSIEYFWGMGYITVVLFAILQNGAFQHDFIDFFMAPFMWYVRFCKWLVYPTYDNGFNQKIAYTGGEVWVIRILAIVAVLFIMGIIMVIIMETIKQYKKMWNEISQMFLIGSLSGIAVLGDVTRKYLPVNLILLFILINMGIMLLRIYLRKKFDYM